MNEFVWRLREHKRWSWDFFIHRISFTRTTTLQLDFFQLLCNADTAYKWKQRHSSNYKQPKIKKYVMPSIVFRYEFCFIKECVKGGKRRHTNRKVKRRKCWKNFIIDDNQTRKVINFSPFYFSHLIQQFNRELFAPYAFRVVDVHLHRLHAPCRPPIALNVDSLLNAH